MLQAMAATVSGGLDVVGDVHGCLPELLELLGCLGYALDSRHHLTHPDGRHLVFVGDLVDRGPDIVGVLELVMQAVAQGRASCVLGNHDANLLRGPRGDSASKPNGDLTSSLAQLRQWPSAFLDTVASFFSALPTRLSLDEGRLMVVHAGDRPELFQPERSHYNVYGRDTNRTNAYGYPLRDDWVSDYGDDGFVVYGHTPTDELLWRRKTLNVDTGCVFGGRLTALRYPELKLVSVEAHDDYAPSRRFNRRRT